MRSLPIGFGIVSLRRARNRRQEECLLTVMKKKEERVMMKWKDENVVEGRQKQTEGQLGSQRCDGNSYRGPCAAVSIQWMDTL